METPKKAEQSSRRGRSTATGPTDEGEEMKPDFFRRYVEFLLVSFSGSVVCSVEVSVGRNARFGWRDVPECCCERAGLPCFTDCCRRAVVVLQSKGAFYAKPIQVSKQRKRFDFKRCAGK